MEIHHRISFAFFDPREAVGVGAGAFEKYLLVVASDSNGLRVLVRLGLVREEKSYGRTYAASREIAKDLPEEPGALQEAHLLLQQHGQPLCKRSAPYCQVCPLAPVCASATVVRGIG
jgi:endonuclease III